MNNSPLDIYVEAVHKSSALELVAATAEAIEKGSYSAAQLNLGELRGMIWLMHYRIDSLQKQLSMAGT